MQPAKYCKENGRSGRRTSRFVVSYRCNTMNTTIMNYTPIQLKLPVDLERIIKTNDAVYSFSEVMEHIDLQKYFVVQKGHETGRPRYDREKLLKIVLFAYMDFGYCSTRFISKLCDTDIRFMWLWDEKEAPSHTNINDFIRKELAMSLEEIFDDINRYIFVRMGVDISTERRSRPMPTNTAGCGKRAVSRAAARCSGG